MEKPQKGKRIPDSLTSTVWRSNDQYKPISLATSTFGDNVVIKAIEKQFFDGHPVSFVMNLQGQALDEHGNYLLGGSAGPETHVSNLLHEMGHLAEREIDKLLLKPK